MMTLKEYILESMNNDFDEAIEVIKKCLNKKGYTEDEYKITKQPGYEIRVYFIKGLNTHHEVVSKMGQYIDKELHKVNSKVSHKTMGKNNKGEYYQAFK